MLKGIKIKKSEAQQEQELDVPQKKWRKTNDEVVVLSLPLTNEPNSVKKLHDRSKYDDDLHNDLLKQRIKDKDKLFGEEIYDDHDKSKSKGKNDQKIQEKTLQSQKKQEVKADKRNTTILSTCGFCLQNEQIGENYIISNGYETMLILPNKKYYDDYYHFYIVPMDHVDSLQQLEEEAWQEVRNFMKCLVSVFDSLKMETVFYENAYNFKDFPHCVLECVAIPNAFLKEAKLDLYFRQGMEELDGFWSTHQKILKLSRELGGIRKQIPKGFPYFYVDFATQYGYGHVIENEKYFSRGFAREILATVLKIDKNKVIAPQVLTNEGAKLIKTKFMKVWSKYDWTQVIKAGEEII